MIPLALPEPVGNPALEGDRLPPQALVEFEGVEFPDIPEPAMPERYALAAASSLPSPAPVGPVAPWAGGSDHGAAPPVESFLILQERLVGMTEAELRDAVALACEAGLRACEMVEEARDERDAAAQFLRAIAMWRRPGRRNGFVYFARAKLLGLIKIGFSRDPLRRVQELRTEIDAEVDLLWYLPGNAIDERALHRMFHHKRRIGEWFELDEAELLTFVPERYYAGATA